MTQKTFTLHWRDGKKTNIHGYDIADAIRKAGYGNGAMAALDYWEEVKDPTPSEVLGKDDSELFTLAELHLQPYSRTPFEKLLVDGEKNIGTLDFRDCADVDIAKKYFSLLSQAKNMYFMLKKIAPIISTLINRTPTGEERNELTDTNIQMLTILNNCKPKP